jgi:hypothetical protein
MKRILSVIASLALLSQMLGCSATKLRLVQTPNIQDPAKEKIIGITIKGGEEVLFYPLGAIIRDDRLEAYVKNKPYEIPINQIERYWIEKRVHSTIRTIGLVATIAVGTVILVGGIAAVQSSNTSHTSKQGSCPFVYSWDGKQFIFDSEPYGGAITRGLERDDYSELEHLTPDKNLYRLMISNEMDETQYTNLMELIVARFKHRTPQ